MNIYIAAQSKFVRENEKAIGDLSGISTLESFYYADESTEWLIPRVKNFLLDSGAFTFIAGKKKKVDWNEYLTRYIDFINRNDVKLFFELDIDSIVGYENVLNLRERLERETGKKPIPVWHKSRGKEEFLRMCDQYDYVAIGGIVTKEIKTEEYRFLRWFVEEAHKRGTKIHGLGFTNAKGLRAYKFDSVDSSSWVYGNKYGMVQLFNGSGMKYISKRKDQGRLKNHSDIAVNNFNEWAKFSRYAEMHL
jgi:hypothetical protein